MNIFKKIIKEAKEIDKTIESFKEIPEPEEEWIWVDGYKGTDRDMCCQGYQYELGKQYDMPEYTKIIECKSGFHLCLNLGDVLEYYNIGEGNRFFKVRALVRKSDKDNYGKALYIDCDGFNIFKGYKDKIVAKSIIFESELTIDEILKDTELEDADYKYKQMAIDGGVHYAITNRKINTLVEDGYSQAFATYLVKDDKFNIAHAIGSQKDLSMDVKVLAILYHHKGE